MNEMEQGGLQFQAAKIEEILKACGNVDDRQMKAALAYQKEHRGTRLDRALMEMGAISESRLLEELADYLHLEMADPSHIEVDLGAVGKIPEPMAIRYRILAVRQDHDVLTVLTNDPLDFYGIEDIRQTTGMAIKLILCELEPLEAAIRYYYAEIRVQRAVEAANNSSQLMGSGIEAVAGNDGLVTYLIDSLIRRAYWNHASDIHIEPFETQTVVRMRIDGILLKFVTLQKNLHSAMIACIKILGDMDIAERRLPQDGHVRMMIDDRMVNMRVSVMPTVYGEKAVIRLLAGNVGIDHMETFGMTKTDYEKVKYMLDSPNGLIYFTGPTGSGKTTTLYMIIEELAKRPVNICTIEDPVERNLPGVNQSQVNYISGMTFNMGLRACLRQDPDIIMVGETRDGETASISVRAAITGHLVFSTLHTNDAASAIVRLEDMGVEPYLVANSLIGVVAQRLMRKLCSDCAQEMDADESVNGLLGRKIRKIRVAKGCSRCNYTGYRGRIAVHEVLHIDKEIRRMIMERASMESIKKHARKEQGMMTLKDRGIQLVEAGITTLDELMKVSYYE